VYVVTVRGSFSPLGGKLGLGIGEGVLVVVELSAETREAGGVGP